MAMSPELVLASDLEAIYIGNLNTVDENLVLPALGAGGSVFTWESGEERFITAEGVVHRPLHGMGNRKVKLTVTASYEGVTAQRVFEATVIQQKRETVVTWIRPVEVSVRPGEEVKLPAFAVVKCKDGRQITLPVVWDALPQADELRVSDKRNPVESAAGSSKTPEEFVVSGHVQGTPMLASAKITVSDLPADTAAFAPGRLIQFAPVRDVELLPGTVFYDYQQNMLKNLLAKDDDSMLYNFRAASGLPTRGASPMTGWDAADCKLKGHTTGHYMSGLALAYAATGDARFLKKIIYMLESLKEVQEAFAASGKVHVGFFSAYDEEQFDLLEVYTKYPEIWAPYYTLDKIMSGLYDIYRCTGLKLALQLESDLGDWVYERLSRLPQTQLDRMWSMYIAGEVGAMLGTMVKLYEMTGSEKHLAAARLFYNEKLYYPMSQNCDTLEDMHGNQHIPQAVGAVEMFRATGEAEYWQISRNFWEIVTGHHIYVNGGVGETEMFHAPDSTCRFLSEKSEESCASYNMLRLTGEVFAYTGDARMLDYYDNTLRNHLMSSCSHASDGGTTYFLPLSPGGQKSFSDGSENTCCHGTGLESRFRYMEHMYGTDHRYYYVNLLIDSRVNHDGMSLEVRTLPDERISVKILRNTDHRLKIHVPAWAGEELGVEVQTGSQGTVEAETDGVPRKKVCRMGGQPEEIRFGDRKLQMTYADGYLMIDGTEDVAESKKPACGLLRGTEVILTLPMQVRILTNASDESLVNVAYGPTLLAAVSEREEFLTAPKSLKRTGAMEFTDGCVKMIPLNRVDREKYHVYFRR